MDLYIKAGAYIEIPMLTTRHQKKIKKCCDVKYYEKDNFCKKCGKNLHYTIIEEQGFLSLRGLIDEIDDDVFASYMNKNESMILFSNSYKCESDFYMKNLDMLDIREITPDMVKQFISNFKDYYKKEIEVLKKRTTAEIEVKFGVLSYWA